MAVQEINAQNGAFQFVLTALPIGAINGGPPPRGPYFFKVKPGTKIDVSEKGTKLALTLNFRKVNDDGSVGDDVAYDAYHYEELPVPPAALPPGADAALEAAFKEKQQKFENRVKYFKRFLASVTGNSAGITTAAGAMTIAQIVKVIEEAPGGVLSYLPPQEGGTGLNASATFLFALKEEQAQFLQKTGETGADGRPNYAIQAQPPKQRATTANTGLAGLGAVPGVAGALPGIGGGTLPGMGAIPSVPTTPTIPQSPGLPTAPGGGADALAGLLS